LLETLESCINKNIKTKTKEFKRLFHGRGNFYADFEYLTVDSIDSILLVVFYKQVEIEEEILQLMKTIFDKYSFESLVVQRRYLPNQPHELLIGNLNDNLYLIENDLKFFINFQNRNLGIFPDMKIGREYIKEISKDKNVLNLFSYTCAFSVYAMSGKAKQVVNVDMSKGALSLGRVNHHLNNLDTKKVKFLPLNILKSWSRIKTFAPYDVIVIDPPSFQKGSFAATKDYQKIIKRLEELASKDCIVLSSLNAPELDCEFIQKLFKENAPLFVYEKRLANLETFLSKNEDKSLKNQVFKRVKND
jgi:23S rRNA (cytosine1962-C5)-methyltransferase